MMTSHPPITVVQIIAPVLVGFVYIGLMSLLKEPVRRRLSALIIAGAGGVYFGGVFGVWEPLFCIPMFYLAYRSVDDMRFVGMGWILHTLWDTLHHLYGNPILPFLPLSSFGCAICDSGLAVWYLVGAPDVTAGLKRQRFAQLSRR